jgi:hypothetical protein
MRGLTSFTSRLLLAFGSMLAALALAGCANTPSSAPAAAVAAPEPTKTVLWLGNSFFYFNNGMPGHVGQLIRGASAMDKAGHRSTMATIGGSGMSWHDLTAHFKPGGVASYSFDDNNNVVFNTFDKPFDVVLMMDCSQCPIHPQLRGLFFEHTKKNAEISRRNGAQPALFMSWAYQDKPEMTQQLAVEYTEAGRLNNAMVVPAGLAFALSVKERPDINLYVADKRHPTLAGTYLGACVSLATLYKTNPEGNSYTAGLDPAVAKHLQSVAWRTAQAYTQPTR